MLSSPIQIASENKFRIESLILNYDVEGVGKGSQIERCGAFNNATSSTERSAVRDRELSSRLYTLWEKFGQFRVRTLSSSTEISVKNDSIYLESRWHGTIGRLAGS